MAAILRQPVEQYVGQTLAEARALAASQHRDLQVGFSGRKKLVFTRVQVDVGADGRVAAVRAG